MKNIYKNKISEIDRALRSGTKSIEEALSDAFELGESREMNLRSVVAEQARQADSFDLDKYRKNAQNDATWQQALENVFPNGESEGMSAELDFPFEDMADYIAGDWGGSLEESRSIIEGARRMGAAQAAAGPWEKGEPPSKHHVFVKTTHSIQIAIRTDAGAWIPDLHGRLIEWARIQE